MASPTEKLAESLKVLQKLQKKYVAIKTSDLSRMHRERLIANGFLKEVMIGWYISSKPTDEKTESTAWYISFWQFCARYLDNRYKKTWCLSAEQSLLIHSGNYSIPKQLLIRSPKANNTTTNLPHNTSLFSLKAALPKQSELVLKDGLRLQAINSALVNASEKFFSQYPTDARIALLLINDASELLSILLAGGHSTVAGRLAGAYRNIGNNRIADDILNTMKSLGYDIRETDPFIKSFVFQGSFREKSPYINRINILWEEMREVILSHFPKSGFKSVNTVTYLQHVQDLYRIDAYHSLSIEGYQVSEQLIERIQSGVWNPDTNHNDREYKDAMAAKGYWQAYQFVKKSIEQVLDNKNAGTVVEKNHYEWYRELFSPSVRAGLLKPVDLAGYRNSPVYIRNSMHSPLNPLAVRDTMPVFFDLLKNENEAAVRAVLGHFIFVYIHPYMDGNGRIARFLMNVMLASGGYPWIVIPVEQRNDYMSSLEEASVNFNILPFSKFLAKLVKASLLGKPVAK